MGSARTRSWGTATTRSRWTLILQRRLPGTPAAQEPEEPPELALPRPASRVRAFRPFIPRLRAQEPLHQLGGGPALVRQKFVDDPVHLRAGDLGHLFFPSPAVTSAGRHWPA